ncbi:MAG: long-chain fatty acid--CoA ligase [Nitrospinota bacterium]|nr:MAG: long-chain fatty acid--CoA ligase [Nitrospinota bacterium]
MDRLRELEKIEELTFPRLLVINAERFGHKTAIREKDFGIWQSYTWRDYLTQVRDLALGLAALGFQRGDKTAIIGDNRPQLYWGIVASQCLGGIPVPLYQDAIEKELRYIVGHAEARFAIAEDQEQVDKLLQIKEHCPHLEYIIYDDPRGMRHYTQPFLLSFTRVQELGRSFAARHPDYFQQEIAQGKPEDIAIICYTSGTTGVPKGVMLSHRNVIVTAYNGIVSEGLRSTEEVMAYLPLAWIGDHIFSLAQSMVAGFTVNCPESPATVLQDMKEIGPTYFFAPPRIWENILTNVRIRMADAAWIKQKLFDFFLDVAHRVEKCKQHRQPIPLGDRLLSQLGRFLIYEPLKDNLGLRRIRIAYTAGEAIGPEVFDFYRSLGVNLKQLYGMTEASALICIQKDGDIKSDTAGVPIPGVKIRISEQGEVLYTSPGVFQGYYKNPEATREVLENGWVHSGDAGFIDQDGHLKIIDRAKDVSRLADGTIFAPKYIENKLKFSPYIKEAVAVGQGKPYVAVLINIDLEAVGNWAERRGLAYTSYTDLAQKPEVYDLIYKEILRVNQSLSEDAQLRGARIKKYLILHKELDPDDEEITRTRKVRRRFIAQKYATLIDALYGDVDSVAVEATVTYEDGRTGTIKADLRIRAVEE